MCLRQSLKAFQKDGLETTYQTRYNTGKLNQEWLFVPMLQPLAQRMVDDKEVHYLWQGMDPATGRRRVKSLAMQHPLIDEVMEHKTEKGVDKTIKNSFGRALEGHQPQYDLKFIIAASGATMRCDMIHLSELVR